MLNGYNLYHIPPNNMHGILNKFLVITISNLSTAHSECCILVTILDMFK